MDDTELEYALYVRKSTDETSGKQAQSIPDQIRSCLEYAKSKGLHIMAKPANFSLFEKEREMDAEDIESEMDNRRLYLETRGYFIVKEQCSAKRPGERPKWNALIEKIRKGEIGGLLSYSPDRQARNLVEGGEIINFADEGLVDLKYANFHYENSASGNMMLGVWFVFSKQYSDKLSEDISRGNKSKHNTGKTLGYKRYGYLATKDNEWIPDPDTFDAMRHAFDMKLARETDDSIADWLQTSGVKKTVKKTGREIIPKAKNLGRIWIDPFYCGIWV